jgi:predicted DsbA family dithiol-disulfide isomerase
MLTVEVFSDYVCPYCFLAEAPLEAAVERFEGRAKLAWRPFELRPYPTPTLRPEGDYLQRAWAGSVYPLAEALGVRMVLPRVSPQPYTRLAFEGALFAEEHGLGRAYTHRMFTAFFQDEQDIGEPAVLESLAGEIGLDRRAFADALARRAYREPCGQMLRRGCETLGISSVPTIIVGRRAVAGLLPQERLEAMIAAELKAAER